MGTNEKARSNKMFKGAIFVFATISTCILVNILKECCQTVEMGNSMLLFNCYLFTNIIIFVLASLVNQQIIDAEMQTIEIIQNYICNTI